VSTISSERGRAVKLALADGQLTLTVNNPDSGSATEELAVGYDRDPMEIGFNAKYLLDITNQLVGHGCGFHAGRSRLPDAGARHRRRRCALRADADAGVETLPSRTETGCLPEG
jgi:hypothetical protein